jgi:hypothetical protein
VRINSHLHTRNIRYSFGVLIHTNESPADTKAITAVLISALPMFTAQLDSGGDILFCMDFSYLAETIYVKDRHYQKTL